MTQSNNVLLYTPVVGNDKLYNNNNFVNNLLAVLNNGLSNNNINTLTVSNILNNNNINNNIINIKGSNNINNNNINLLNNNNNNSSSIDTNSLRTNSTLSPPISLNNNNSNNNILMSTLESPISMSSTTIESIGNTNMSNDNLITEGHTIHTLNLNTTNTLKNTSNMIINNQPINININNNISNNTLKDSFPQLNLPPIPTFNTNNTSTFPVFDPSKIAPFTSSQNGDNINTITTSNNKQNIRKRKRNEFISDEIENKQQNTNNTSLSPNNKRRKLNNNDTNNDTIIDGITIPQHKYFKEYSQLYVLACASESEIAKKKYGISTHIKCSKKIKSGNNTRVLKTSSKKTLKSNKTVETCPKCDRIRDDKASNWKWNKHLSANHKMKCCMVNCNKSFTFKTYLEEHHKKCHPHLTFWYKPS